MDRSAVETLLGSQAHNHMVAEKARRLQEGGLIALRCYFEVLEKLDGDARAAAKIFEGLTKTAKTLARRGRGKADPELDQRLLDVGDTAPPGGLEAGIAAAAGAKTRKQVDAATKRYRRLRKARAESRRQMKLLADRVISAYQDGGAEAASEALTEHVRRTNALVG
jgi:hypothetical protein